MRAKTRFSRWLNFRVFQRNPQIPVMSGRRPLVKGCFEAVVNVSGAVMSTASHEGSSVNSFLPMPIRGELSFPQGFPC
jgi:hypothetical protein